MRFICTEFDANTNNLYRKEPIDQSVIPDNNQLLTKSHKIDTKDGVTYAYIADTLREVLFSQFIYDGTARTPSAWLTAKGLPGTDHTSLTGTFDFQNASCADIKCSYFFTIIAEDGLHFALPRRISTSKEIKSFTVISELKNYEDDFSFQGESGKIYTIGENPGDTVKAITIDSTLKSHRINKYKALQNVLTIQSGTDSSPLDYVLHKGNYYLTISRSEIKSDLFIYTCVLENTATNTISGSNIIVPELIRSVPTSDYIATEQTTTSLSYTDLTTVGPTCTVNVTTNGVIIVMLYCAIYNTTADAKSYMSFSASGISADDSRALIWQLPSGSRVPTYGASFLVTGLTSGSLTITAKYKVSSGTGGFGTRRMIVIPY